MQGFSPRLPLTKDKEGLYSMNTNILNAIKQDLKMLLLTSPGERVMMPDYGVGLRRYLFNQASSQTIQSITNSINSQISKYMSFITLTDVKVEMDSLNENLLNISITYFIPSIGAAQNITI